MNIEAYQRGEIDRLKGFLRMIAQECADVPKASRYAAAALNGAALAKIALDPPNGLAQSLTAFGAAVERRSARAACARRYPED